MRKSSMGTSRWVGRLVACVALMAAFSACGDDDDPSSSDETTTTAADDDTTTTAPTDDVCADREALSSSVDALKDVDVAAEGTNGVTAAVEDVSTDLEGAARVGGYRAASRRWTTSRTPSTSSTPPRPTSNPKVLPPR